MGLVLGLLFSLESQQLQLIQAYDVIQGTLSLTISCNSPYPSSAYQKLPPTSLLRVQTVPLGLVSTVSFLSFSVPAWALAVHTVGGLLLVHSQL